MAGVEYLASCRGRAVFRDRLLEVMGKEPDRLWTAIELVKLSGLSISQVYSAMQGHADCFTRHEKGKYRLNKRLAERMRQKLEESWRAA